MAEDVDAVIRISIDDAGVINTLGALNGEFEELTKSANNLGSVASKAGEAIADGFIQPSAEVLRMQEAFKTAAAASSEASRSMIADSIAFYKNEQDMGRISLNERLEAIQAVVDATEAGTRARVAAERALQEAYKESINEQIADMQRKVDAGKASQSQQIDFLREIANEEAYSLKNRGIAEDEYAQKQKDNAQAQQVIMGNSLAQMQALRDLSNKFSNVNESSGNANTKSKGQEWQEYSDSTDYSGVSAKAQAMEKAALGSYRIIEDAARLAGLSAEESWQLADAVIINNSEKAAKQIADSFKLASDAAKEAAQDAAKASQEAAKNYFAGGSGGGNRGGGGGKSTAGAGDEGDEAAKNAAAAQEHLGNVVESVREKLTQQGEEAHSTGEKHKASANESAYAWMDFGYVLEGFGVKGAMALGNIGFVLRDLEELNKTTIAGFVALGVVLATVGLGVAQLKDALDEAAKSEDQLVSVGALLKNQGGDFENFTKEADKYATSLSVIGRYTKTDILEGMKEMLAAGVSANDMLRSQQAALDLAAAKGITVKQAEIELAAAYDGRLISLKRLGLVTADEVKNGLSYETVLDRIEKRMGGSAAAAADTYIGKQQNLKNITAALSEEAGNALIPAMEQITDAEKGAVESLKPLVDQFVAFMTNNDDVKKGIKDFSQVLSDIASVAIPAAFHAVEGLITGISKLGTALKNGEDALKSFGSWFNQNAPAIKTFFTDTIEVVAIGSLILFRDTLGTVVAEAIAAAGSSVLGALAAGFEIATTAIANAQLALAGFLTVETAATLGMNLVIAGLVLGIVDLWNNWDDRITAIENLWTGLGTTIANVGTSIQGTISNLETSIGNVINHLGGLGGVGDAAIADAQGRAAAAAKAAADGKPDTSTFSGGWGDDTYSGPSGGKMETSSWGDKPYVPPTTPSNKHIEGTSKPKGPALPSSLEKADLIVTDKEDPIKDRQAAFENAYKLMGASLDAYREKVVNATTIDEKRAAQQQLSIATTKNYADEIALQTRAINYGTQTAAALQTEYTKDIAVTNAAAKTHNDLAATINREEIGRKTNKDVIAAQKEELQKLHTEYEAAKKVSDAEFHSITENNAAIQKNTDLRLANEKAASQQKNALADLQVKWSENTERMQRENADFINTQGATTKQLYDYYAGQYQEDYNLYVYYLKQKDVAHATEYQQYAIAEENKMYAEAQKLRQEDVANEKKAYDEKLSLLETFMDDVTNKHKNLAGILKDITDKINKQNDAVLGKFLLGPEPGAKPGSTATPSLGQLFGGLFGGGSKTANSAAPSNGMDALFSNGTQIKPLNVNIAQQAGSDLQLTTDSTTGATVAAIAGSAGATSSQAVANAAAVSTISKLSESVQSVADSTSNFADSGAANNADLVAGAGSIYKIIGSSQASYPGGFLPEPGGPTLSSESSNANQTVSNQNVQASSIPSGGQSVGQQDTANYVSAGLQIFQSLQQGKNGGPGGSFSQFLGGAGEAIGTAYGGPVGGMIGQAAGSLIGSLFGNKDLGPSHQPDVYNTVPTVQAEGELMGHGGATGLQGTVNFDPYLDPVLRQLSKPFGTNAASPTGVNELQFIQRYVSQNQGSKDPYTAGLVADLQRQFGDTATGANGQMIGGKDGNFQVVGGAASGTAVAIQNLAQQAISAIGAAGNTTAIFSVKRTAPNFQDANVAQWGTSDKYGNFTQYATGAGGTGTGTVGGLPGTRQTQDVSTTTASASSTLVKAAAQAVSTSTAPTGASGSGVTGTIVSLSEDTIRKLNGGGYGGGESVSTGGTGRNPTGTIIGGILGAAIPGVGGLIGGAIGSLFGHHHNHAPTVDYSSGASAGGFRNAVINNYNVTLPNAVLMGTTIAQVADTISKAITKNAQTNFANQGYH